jgi:hypothetical protein
MLPRLRLPFGRHRRESGQILPIFILLLPISGMLLGAVVDFGHAYWLRGKLQSSADAAALAGAQMLPDEAQALSLAQEYSAGDGRHNDPVGIDGVGVEVSFQCTNPRFCEGVNNAITVEETGEVETTFLRFFGMETLDVSATASACSPCGSVPMDVMVVIDRSGSMCEYPGSTPDPSCRDLNNAKEGVRAFLSVMDPGYDKVGLAVFPAMTGSDPCSTSANYTTRNYVVAQMAFDYKTGTALNPASRLLSSLACVKGVGGTAYTAAIDAAQAELDVRGRPDARDVIVFMSDGDAKDAPPVSSWAPADYTSQPCASAIRRANAYRSRGTTIYSVGYDIPAPAAAPSTVGWCKQATGSRPREVPNMSALQSLQAIADPGQFYNQPDPGSMNAVFLAIAADMSQGRSRLTRLS